LFVYPIEEHFWWIGLLLLFFGTLISISSFILAFNDWAIERLWLYLLAGTMFALAGLQFFVFWVVMRVLYELNIRESEIQNDLHE
jgi:hypothetical protein